MDLALTRASSALDRLADMTEDVCKEYRGCCIGMRFLHPVWFIDEVELADCDYTRRTTVNGAEKLLTLALALALTLTLPLPLPLPLTLTLTLTLTLRR